MAGWAVQPQPVAALVLKVNRDLANLFRLLAAHLVALVEILVAAVRAGELQVVRHAHSKEPVIALVVVAHLRLTVPVAMVAMMASMLDTMRPTLVVAVEALDHLAAVQRQQGDSGPMAK